MTEQSHGLDYGLIGALTDIAAAIVLAVLLALATDWTGDAAPRPIVVAALYGTPGVIALLGVIAQRPWLLLAGGLPLCRPPAWRPAALRSCSWCRPC